MGSRQTREIDLEVLALKPSSSVAARNAAASHRRRRNSGTRRMFRRRRCRLLNLFVIVTSSLFLEMGCAYYHEYPSSARRHPSTGRRRNHHFRVMLPRPFGGATVRASELEPTEGDDQAEKSDKLSKLEKKLMRRVTRLEALVAKQEVEIRRLTKTAQSLTETSEAFSLIIQALRDAGVQTADDEDPDEAASSPDTETKGGLTRQPSRVIESFDDSMIFGTAPSSVSDAADSAGAAILAAMLGGKQRMLVDVRDAELSTDSETLVQFIELAILPVAAGLEGLKSTRNRVKIVFPKVSQLLEYRKTMALAAPEVVALSTLGFDPVEENDKIVVIVAPEPDDEEGLAAMKALIEPTATSEPIQQPVVILNYHMVPVAQLPADFETAYHLRLLSVQYMAGDSANEFFRQFQGKESLEQDLDAEGSNEDVASGEYEDEVPEEPAEIEDEALEAAMKHAHEVGMNQGLTRAMVIRAYPRPWHVFVDTSPDTDTDFEVAATFDDEPSLDKLNLAIVECLEGSETEDELVAQQMQQALEEGQLDRVAGIINEAFLDEYEAENDDNLSEEIEQECTDDDDDEIIDNDNDGEVDDGI